MEYCEMIEKIMPDVENGSTDTFVIYHDSEGVWHCEYAKDQFGDKLEWMRGLAEKDPLALVLSGTDFSRGSYPFVYDSVVKERFWKEYSTTYHDSEDSKETRALVNFFDENIGEFEHETTEYLMRFERPVRALKGMLPFSMVGEFDEEYDVNKIDDAVHFIESKISDLIHRKKDEIETSDKTMVDGYTEISSLRLAGKTVFLAENPNNENPYMVGFKSWDDALGVEIPHDLGVTGDYLEAVGEFVDRQRRLLDALEQERMPDSRNQTMTDADCIEGGMSTELVGKVIIIKPESLAPEYRTAQWQYAICTGGFGASPQTHGTAVFAKNLYSGESRNYKRLDVAGVADRAKMPEWAKVKLSEMEKMQNPKSDVPGKISAKKTSLSERINGNKQKAELNRANKQRETPAKKKPDRGREG